MEIKEKTVTLPEKTWLNFAKFGVLEAMVASTLSHVDEDPQSPSTRTLVTLGPLLVPGLVTDAQLRRKDRG